MQRWIKEAKKMKISNRATSSPPHLRRPKLYGMIKSALVGSSDPSSRKNRPGSNSSTRSKTVLSRRIIDNLLSLCAQLPTVIWTNNGKLRTRWPWSAAICHGQTRPTGDGEDHQFGRPILGEHDPATGDTLPSA
ncbi:conserved hypothetical protein [Trichinella spiralis]|uniref:hypothetical protein n=1 Tax=Trichinella spiralis TaxID=6334 RepID=UPI0001EFDF57|nr:conserved hypothetical protein [Trichinella spiralis]